MRAQMYYQSSEHADWWINDFIFNYQLLNNDLATFTDAMQRLFFFFQYKEAMQINISKVNFVSTNQFYII